MTASAEGFADYMGSLPYVFGVMLVTSAWAWLPNESLTEDLIKANDDGSTGDEEKERILLKLFEARGIDVEFYGGEA